MASFIFKFVFTCLGLLNVASFLLFYEDKRRAIEKQYRLKESLLLKVAFFGGSLGGLLAMEVFRHKTKKPRFYIGLPCMLMFHIFVLILLWVAFFWNI